jgi:AcrR family transcriptional regulator
MKGKPPAARRRSAEDLREDILAAATDLFLESGYAGANLDAVIERVGGSKRAIYSHFGGKKELFAAIAARLSARPLAALESEEVSGRDVESTLLDFGTRVLALLMLPKTLALYRLVVAEGIRFPDLARAFFDGAPGRASEGLAAALERFARRGEIKCPHHRLAAEHFIGMLRDDLHLRVVLGLRPPPSQVEVDRAVREAVRIFLHGCQPALRSRKGPKRP